ncbi:MAG: hypothetical protein V1778_03175 [bacterium]
MEYLHTRKSKSSLLSIVRLVLFIGFFVLFWLQFGWGVAGGALVIFLAIGGKGEQRWAFVRVPGAARLFLEAAYGIGGCIVAFLVLGSTWGVAVLLFFLFSALLGLKRYQRLLAA